jgi:hypothetical protein
MNVDANSYTFKTIAFTDCCSKLRMFGMNSSNIQKWWWERAKLEANWSASVDILMKVGRYQHLVPAMMVGSAILP